VVPPETQGWPRFGSADLTGAILHRLRNNRATMQGLVVRDRR
jgi:hypothetical protein